MIRQKLIKRTFLKGTLILKLPALRLHVTSKALARGALRRSSVNDVAKHVESEDNPLNSLNTNVNFLGIESDEGVITAGSNGDLAKKKVLNTKPKEQFHRASFGVIRYDSDNKVKYHGQYAQAPLLTFPRYNSEHSVVSGDRTKIASRRDQSKVNKLHSSVTSSEFCDDDVNYSDALKRENFGNSDSVINEENISYMDEVYFNDSVIEKEQAVENISSHSSLSEELNFNEVLNKDISDFNDSIKDYQDTNYIDQYYFNNYHENEQSVKNINDHSSVPEELNFIDQNYFGNQTVSESNKLSQDQNVFQNTPFINEKYTECNNTNFLGNLKSNNIESKKPDLLQNNTESLKYKNKENITPNLFIDQSNARISNKKHENNINSFKNMMEQFAKKNSVNVKSYTNTFRFNNLPVDESVSKFAARTVKVNELSTDKANDTNYSKTVESFFSMKDPKQAKINSKESNDVDKTSAYDFVQDLRKQNEVPESDAKRRSKILDVKVDSKGFRILKNQAVDLSNFTQDETFNLLKQNILYSDDNLVILNKPYSLVMHESRTTKSPCLSSFLDKLAKELNQQKDDPKLYTVHRLDKETTGCLLLARNITTAQFLKSLFAQRKIIKTYWIVTSKVPDPPEGVIDIPIAEGSVGNKNRMVLHPELSKDVAYTNHSKRGKPAVTSYKVVAESGNAALVEVTPLTGIKHQIRVHFGFGLCCPIIGDHKYSHLDKLAPQKLPSDLLQRLHVRQSKVRHIPLHIHAKSVTIPGYFEKQDLHIRAPLPKHMQENLRRLKFKK